MAQNPINVIQRIKQVRKLKQRRIHDCATLLDISKGTYAQFEEGKLSLTLPEIELLAAFFCIPTQIFFDRRPINNKQLSIVSKRIKPQYKKLRHKMIQAQLALERQKRGLSLDEIHEGTGIPLKDLKAYENGGRPVPFDDLLQISEVLSLPFVSFQSGISEKESHLSQDQNQTRWHTEFPKETAVTKDQKQDRYAYLYHAIEKLPKEDQAHVAKFLLKKLRAL